MLPKSYLYFFKFVIYLKLYLIKKIYAGQIKKIYLIVDEIFFNRTVNRKLLFMERKLRELIGQSDVWLFINSSSGWVKNVEILDVDSNTVTFRYQHESSVEVKVWEKTTRLDNILEIDLRVATVPKCEQKLNGMRDKFTRLLEQE